MKSSGAATPEIPRGKETILGLYVTAKEAYEKWKANPERVKILDVGTTEEFLFVGHPAMAWSIPASSSGMNGRKNSGVPWTYEVAPGKLLLPKVR
jgi:hypothetical protein